MVELEERESENDPDDRDNADSITDFLNARDTDTQSTNIVQFKNIKFDLSHSRSVPIEGSSNETSNSNIEEHNDLIEFLQKLNRHGLLGERNHAGEVVYADDQYVNQ